MERQEIYKKWPRRFEDVLISADRVVIRDNFIGALVDLIPIKGMLFCHHCESEKCLHIGYCYSIHQLYGTMWK